MNPRSAAHERLRHATRVDHERVDACFAQGLHDDATYARYLAGMHALLSLLAARDPQLATDYAPQRARLTDDMAALAIDSLNTFTIAAPSLHDAPTRLGARYVVEGSALGARFLQRQAQSLGHTPARGASFLAYHVERGITHWPRLLQALAAHDPASPGFHTMLAAARDTFALAASCFDPMGLAGKDHDERQNPD